MDLEEWEILSNDGFLDYLEDGEKRASKTIKRSPTLNPRTVFKTDHFICPASPPRHSRMLPKHLLPVPINLESPTAAGKIIEAEAEAPKEVIKKVPIINTSTVIMQEVVKNHNLVQKETAVTDQEPVSSQVFFKKENEFVDMILDSPKSTKGGFVPPSQIDTFNFEDKADGFKGEAMENNKISSPRIKKEHKANTKEEVSWEENNGRLNLWKWSLTGIGAICSFTAATICIIILGSQHNKQQQQNQKLRFQIYTDDKSQRIKQVVQHATKFNEAIAAGRGVPMTRAHITYGGYYDGL